MDNGFWNEETEKKSGALDERYYYPQFGESNYEAEEKKRYEELSKKTAKNTKTGLLVGFGIMFVIFTALTVLFLALGVADEETGDPMWITMLIPSVMMLALMAITPIISKPVSYEKHKARVEKYGYGHTGEYFDPTALAVKVEIMEKRISELEERVSELENK